MAHWNNWNNNFRKGNERNNLEYFFFKKWKEARKLTIEQLRKLAEEIQESETDYRKGQVVYSSAGIVSGGLAIAGILTAPFTAGLSLGLTAGSLGVGATSGVVGLTHSVINYSQVRSRCKDAKKVLERDDKLTEELMKYINVLVNKMDDIGSYWETVKSVVLTLNTLRGSVSNICSASQTTRAYNAIQANNLDEAAKILNIGETTQKVLPGRMKKSMVLIIDDAGVVKFAEATSKVGKEAAAQGKASTKFVEIASKVALPIAIIGTVMDVWSLIDNADKLNSGQLSAHARQLMKVADELEDQIRIYEEEIRKLLMLRGSFCMAFMTVKACIAIAFSIIGLLCYEIVWNSTHWK